MNNDLKISWFLVFCLYPFLFIGLMAIIVDGKTKYFFHPYIISPIVISLVVFVITIIISKHEKILKENEEYYNKMQKI